MKIGSLTSIPLFFLLVADDVEWPKWAVKQYILIITTAKAIPK